jgi:hypothetical protein
MNGTDPSAQDVAVQKSLFTDHKVKIFLNNQQVTDSLTESYINLAHANGIPVVGVYETMPTPGYDYQSWMLGRGARHGQDPGRQDLHRAPVKPAPEAERDRHQRPRHDRLTLPEIRRLLVSLIQPVGGTTFGPPHPHQHQHAAGAVTPT